MHGKGRLMKGNAFFDGIFEKGWKKAGKLVTPYGEYVGKFENGEMHDEAGQFTWKDGRVYKGGFAYGEMHGRGAITFPNGQEVWGLWEGGENLSVEEVRKIKRKMEVEEIVRNQDGDVSVSITLDSKVSRSFRRVKRDGV
ncbi:unnamed protein product [Sphagnum balticum]